MTDDPNIVTTCRRPTVKGGRAVAIEQRGMP